MPVARPVQFRMVNYGEFKLITFQHFFILFKRKGVLELSPLHDGRERWKILHNQKILNQAYGIIPVSQTSVSGLDPWAYPYSPETVVILLFFFNGVNWEFGTGNGTAS